MLKWNLQNLSIIHQDRLALEYWKQSILVELGSYHKKGEQTKIQSLVLYITNWKIAFSPANKQMYAYIKSWLHAWVHMHTNTYIQTHIHIDT